MQYKNTIEIVRRDLQDLEILVGNFSSYNTVPNIELDLALSRLRNVYDILLSLRMENNNQGRQALGNETLEFESLTKSAESLKADVIKISNSEQTVVTTVVAEAPEPELPPDQPIPDIPQEIPVPEVPPGIPAPPSPQKPPVKPNPPSPPSPQIPQASEEKVIPKSQVKDEKIFINEKLGEQNKKKDIISKLQGQAIKSIVGSMGINDKFFYIRELFGGNADNFRATMEELDLARNFNEAYSILTDNFDWDMDSEAVQMLLNLVRRKFIPTGNE